MKTKKRSIVIIVAVMLCLLIGGILLSNKDKLISQFSLSPTPPPVPKEITSLVETVGQRTVLPKDETPTVATVTNVSQLENQPFFAKARNGDKVLIYAQAKKAVLYRPISGEIVEVSPVEIVSGDASGSTEASVSAAFNTSGSQPVLKIRL